MLTAICAFALNTGQKLTYPLDCSRSTAAQTLGTSRFAAHGKVWQLVYSQMVKDGNRASIPDLTIAFEAGSAQKGIAYGGQTPFYFWLSHGRYKIRSAPVTASDRGFAYYDESPRVGYLYFGFIDQNGRTRRGGCDIGIEKKFGLPVMNTEIEYLKSVNRFTPLPNRRRSKKVHR